MSNSVLFYTQIASIVVFLIALFTLYRLLVSQKDATIETLKERVASLEAELQRAKESSPDILAEKYAKRVDLLNAELERLSVDQAANELIIQQKKADLERAQEEMEGLRFQIEDAQEILADYLCPHCGARMDVREYHTQEVEYMGRVLDDEHEYISYECGLAISDGKEIAKCSSVAGKTKSIYKSKDV